MKSNIKPPTFGTDGIRAQAGHFPMDEATITRLAQASCILLSEQHKTVILGRDTRASGEWITQCLIQGFVAGGATVLDGGIMPTAAVSCAMVEHQAALGIVITASHNPAKDNGLKFFAAQGKKLRDSEQARILAAFTNPPTASNGRAQKLSEPLSAWRHAMPKVDLSGLTIMLDCAHGAASYAAPVVLRELGAKLVLRGCTPDGENINRQVGALHPPQQISDCQLAICLDGDADRIVLICPDYGVIDGDDILYLLKDSCSGPLVSTVMANGALEEALKGRLLRSKVGDRNVAKLMKESNASIGAEPSGHVLFKDGMPSGDGLYAALRVLQSCGHPPWNFDGWQKWPVAQQNIRYTGSTITLASLSQPDLARQAGQRVIIRYSGTEPLLRIMVEGPEAQTWLQTIAKEFIQRIT